MSQPAGWASRLNPATKPGGTTNLVLGFVIGALFTLLPMYYYQTKREALRTSPDQPLATSAESSGTPPEKIPERGPSKPFASRLTYELSRPPEERTFAAPKAVPPAAVARATVPVTPVAPVAKAPASAPPPATSVVVASPPPAERVANARPISIVPPDPRDRTAQIERDAQKPEYREPPRPQPKPRVFEGRDIELKPAAKPVETASRPNAANGMDTEGDRVSGVAPIKPPAKQDTPPKAAAKPDASAKAKAKAERTVVAKAPAAAAPATEAAESPGLAPPAGSDVESRLDATRSWLAASAPTTHTIQLMGTNSEEQLKAQLKILSKVVEPTKLYVYRTKAQGKPSITVVYGAYADRQSASQALEKLPASITANKPVLRTVNGIRAEIKQNNTKGE